MCEDMRVGCSEAKRREIWWVLLSGVGLEIWRL